MQHLLDGFEECPNCGVLLLKDEDCPVCEENDRKAQPKKPITLKKLDPKRHKKGGKLKNGKY